MKLARQTMKMILGALPLLLVACGGGAGPTLGGGIGGTGKPLVTLGTVTATDVVTVGGLVFDTTSTSVTIGGMGATVADIRVGMVALVHGTDDAGALAADVIQIEEVIKGVLEVKLDANTLRVQGQTVQVEDATVFGPGISPASTSGLVLGDKLEIYGFVRSSGVVVAARVQREASLSEIRLIGFAVGVNTGAQTFSIGTQMIDYAGADTGGLAGGVPTNGQFLRVRGLNMLDGMNRVVASEIKPQHLGDEDDNEDTQIEGFVTGVHSATEFVVGGVTVNTNAGTTYEGGIASDVVVGAKVSVEGGLTNGVLVADSVEFEDAVKVESDVASVVGNMITLVGLPGLTVMAGAHTEYDGAASSIGDISPGDHVEIRARVMGATMVMATRLKETSADTDIELQGPVDAVPAASDPTFSILGISIDTTSFAFGDFRGPAENAIGRAAFFAAISHGTIVEAHGEIVSGSAAWDEVEIESED